MTTSWLCWSQENLICCCFEPNVFGFNPKILAALIVIIMYVCKLCIRSCRNFRALLLRLGTKAASIDNRKLLGMCFVSALIGSALVGDWQSIGHDPCSSEFLSPETSEELQNDFGSSWLNNSSAIIPIDEQSNGTSDAIRYLVEKCESLNSSTDQCFWNPQSRITGEFCNTCLDTCLSIQKSLGIYQFSVGMFLLAISTAFAFVLISAISSDITSVHSQV